MSDLLRKVISRVINSIRFRLAAKFRRNTHVAAVVEREKLDLSLLPVEFDPDLYLKTNPDLGPVDPVEHFIKYGRHEVWRPYSLPGIHLSKVRAMNPEWETLLVVSHEASRSGAPILALDLVQRLSGRYNVVVLLLGGGPLLSAFEEAAVVLVEGFRIKGNPEYSGQVVEFLNKKFNFKFALVNSLESNIILESLARNFIHTTYLIHEFASSYPNSTALLTDAIMWAGKLVFSAALTLENAIESLPELKSAAPLIMPQGRCLLPEQQNNERQSLEESESLRKMIRPEGDTERKFVVLGAGYVNFRKGVDLFIQCAIKAMLAPGGEKFRFVWIGKGHDPQLEGGYSVYLADQINRSGLHDRFLMLGETSVINAAYAEADALFISSRLDPLPNVAIDALMMHIPVICFDKASGIADFLDTCGLHEACVADYLDVDSAFQKLSALASSRTFHEQVANQSFEASKTYFDADKYAGQLERLGVEGHENARQEKQDVTTILDSGLFCSAGGNANAQDVQDYVRGSARGINPQRLHVNFRADAYLAEHGVAKAGADPFADYIRAGRPQGAWNESE
ncbi:glycosyltransferase [Pseudomonas fluorescens]|uniref:glycosyltransferase n=1 Tax=Pseudomonas fluorescens TaxID=294 RepID=UPI001F0879D5|nr:glycosyltransferase [Pseudomonas fluorescens]